jgi:hypothetical protein
MIVHDTYVRAIVSVVAKLGTIAPIVLMENRVRTLPPSNWHIPSLSSLQNSQKTRTSNGACRACGQENLE